MDLPYKCDYAKSNRASCRGCRSTIGKDSLRLAVMVQSPMFDGKSPHWYHNHCFFLKQRPKTVDDILGFESLRWDDQKTIKTKIETLGSAIVPGKKGKKRDAAASAAKKATLGDFTIEYSKSSRATCRGCEQKIMKEEIRISKKDFESDIGKRYGGQDLWHHVGCFAKLRSELGYFESADQLPGFKSLKKDDQKEAKEQLPAIKQEDVPEKKLKVEKDEPDGNNKLLEKELEQQNKKMFQTRDKLKALDKKELLLLLETNNQEPPPGEERILDLLADIMTFGALERCPECKNGQLRFEKFGYKCHHGHLTEWTKCVAVIKEPKRRPFVVPNELAEEYTFLNKYKPSIGVRKFKEGKPSTVVKKEEEEESTGPKVQRAGPPLYNMEFVILGTLNGKKEEVKKKIASLGGKVPTKIKETVMAIVSTPEDVEKLGARMQEAQNADIQVVPVEFLDEAKEYSGRIPELVMKKSICSWGADPHTRLPPEPSSSKSNAKSKSGSMFVKSGSSMVKVTLKNGGAVDPDSGLADCAHIYCKGKDKYTAVLGVTDIQSQKNSYYKLQLLQSDSGNRFWLFRSWGRIGTTIGGTKVEKLDLYAAISEFNRLYEEKTGNQWCDRDHFVKRPHCMYPIDVDYGEEEAEMKLDVESAVPSKLDKPVQELIQLIFDVNSMKKVMLEFELDTEKMPLGKLSKTQLQNAYKVLSELQSLIESEGSHIQFVDASNRFYTFVPHSFGINDPPIINNIAMLEEKIEMVENLMELEIAYGLMKSTGGNHSIDAHYEKLNTDIGILDKDTEEFKIIEEYVKNTHAATHSNYKLEIDEVYTVKRTGEEKRYKPFRKLHNRRLLWHGSRTTNFAGILSQGLRIAPPEAPVTGYMFGKGIYFADMVSKSANYCFTNSTDNTGLMLLCEVALGEMHELEHAKYIEKLPKGKHSVKGVGRTEPDPTQTKELPNGVLVPVGEGIEMPRSSATSLLYNEYIVYDVAQVNIQYLLKMKFKYHY